MYGEKLDKNADAGDYVKDFRKSDAPQFKGKSDKKIQKMAINAYLSKKEKQMSGNKHDNGVLEQGTDEIRISYQEDMTVSNQ